MEEPCQGLLSGYSEADPMLIDSLGYARDVMHPALSLANCGGCRQRWQAWCPARARQRPACRRPRLRSRWPMRCAARSAFRSRG